MAIGPRFPVKPPENYQIPWEWQHIVCICPEGEGTKYDLDRAHYMLCPMCDKFKRFYATRCRACRQFYLMVFYHPDWTPTGNLCWECLPHHDKSRPPADWVKPRQRKTTEEITNGLSDLFSMVDLDAEDFDF